MALLFIIFSILSFLVNERLLAITSTVNIVFANFDNMSIEISSDIIGCIDVFLVVLMFISGIYAWKYLNNIDTNRLIDEALKLQILIIKVATSVVFCGAFINVDAVATIHKWLNLPILVYSQDCLGTHILYVPMLPFFIGQAGLKYVWGAGLAVLLTKSLKKRLNNQ